jgi:hypothetical protein
LASTANAAANDGMTTSLRPTAQVVKNVAFFNQTLVEVKNAAPHWVRLHIYAAGWNHVLEVRPGNTSRVRVLHDGGIYVDARFFDKDTNKEFGSSETNTFDLGNAPRYRIVITPRKVG